MSLRTRIRNWLLKPSAAELANTDGQGSVVAELVWGHVQRQMARDLERKYPDAQVQASATGMVAYVQQSREVDLGEVDLECLR